VTTPVTLPLEAQLVNDTIELQLFFSPA